MLEFSSYFYEQLLGWRTLLGMYLNMPYKPRLLYNFKNQNLTTVVEVPDVYECIEFS